MKNVLCLVFLTFWKFCFAQRKLPPGKDVESFLNESLKMISELRVEMARSSMALGQISRESRDTARVSGMQELEVRRLEGLVLGERDRFFPAFLGAIRSPFKGIRLKKPATDASVVHRQIDLVTMGVKTPAVKAPAEVNKTVNTGCIIVQELYPPNAVTPNGKTPNPAPPTRTLNPKNIHDPYFYYPLSSNTSVSNRPVTCKMICCPADGTGSCFELRPEVVTSHAESAIPQNGTRMSNDAPSNSKPGEYTTSSNSTNSMQTIPRNTPSCNDITVVPDEPTTISVSMTSLTSPSGYTTSKLPGTKRVRNKTWKKLFSRTHETITPTLYTPLESSPPAQKENIQLNIYRNNDTLILEYDVKPTINNSAPPDGQPMVYAAPPPVSEIDAHMSIYGQGNATNSSMG